MAKQRGSGDLSHRVAFDKRVDGVDGYGNTVGVWEEQFQDYAGFVHMRGGEAIMASRLQGEHTQVIFVRASANTRQVTTDWRIREPSAGEFVDGTWVGPAFNLRDITPSDDRAWLDMLCQSGVAEG